MVLNRIEEAVETKRPVVQSSPAERSRVAGSSGGYPEPSAAEFQQKGYTEMMIFPPHAQDMRM
jgi:hypothetical protein